jgi:hypothetical protein
VKLCHVTFRYVMLRYVSFDMLICVVLGWVSFRWVTLRSVNFGWINLCLGVATLALGLPALCLKASGCSSLLYSDRRRFALRRFVCLLS